MQPTSQTPSNNGEITVTYNVMLSLAIGCTILVDYFSGRLFSHNPLLIFGLMSSGMLIAVTHALPKLQTKVFHFIYTALFHILFAILLIFIVPIQSTYLLLWILLIYLAEYYYLQKGLFVSLAILLATVVGAFWHQQGGDALRVYNILPPFVLTASLGIVLTRIILGARNERVDMAQKIIHAEYEHERLINLINSMTESVLAVTDSGLISIFNAATLDLIDTNVDLSGKSISEVLKLEDENHQPVDIMSVARETHYLLRRSDLFLIFGPNDRIALELNISRTALVSPLVKRQGYTFLLRDITQQKSLDEERDEFISVVSHELRTPITIAEANISMAQMVLGQPDKSKKTAEETLDKAHRQVLFLSDMVNDLSTLSRAERTDKEMGVETFEIADILSELDKAYQPQAEKKSLFLKIDADTKLPRVTTSRLYLKEIMQNFITNAIKYTLEGGVTIRAHVTDGKMLKLSVQDTGIGISKSEHDRVYDKFWRSEDPLTRQTNGTGLGLYITAKLARRIGAQLDLESAPKAGSTFSITLPIVAVQAIDQANVVKNEVATLLN